ncbi:MAG: hypothetical protein JST67_01030 [Bacteroidetes bacterium]|nr:hypothetical protein [Bacteroidota bacterium]
MKKCTLVFILLLTKTVLYAQYDTIKYVNGNRQAAKIIEITKKVVKFKNPHDTTGPTFTIPTKYIERFIFKNGCIELKSVGYINCVKDPMQGVIKNENFTRNILSIDAAQLADAHIQLSYEHVFSKRAFGLVVYANHGFFSGRDSAKYSRIESKINGGQFYKNNYVGVDLKYYPGLHKKIAWYIALGIECGAATNMLIDYSIKYVAYQNGTPYYTNEYDPYAYYKTRLYLGYHIREGFVYRVSKHFVLQGNMAIGMSQYTTDPNPDPHLKNDKYLYFPKISGGILVGYAF